METRGKWNRTIRVSSRRSPKGPASRVERNFREPSRAYQTEFQRDRARIIHSRAFRRLEYQTEVPLSGPVIIAHALTRSIEVASIAARFRGIIAQ